MNSSTTVILITLSSLSLIASGTTLVITILGAKKVKAEVDDAKLKMNNTVSNLRHALDNLEL